MNPFKAEVLVILKGGASQIVDADQIGGADGELILFKNEGVVAIYANGHWLSAAFMTALAAGLPS